MNTSGVPSDGVRNIRDVSVQHGDFIGRNKIVYGDEVRKTVLITGGLHVTVGSQAGQAIPASEDLQHQLIQGLLDAGVAFTDVTDKMGVKSGVMDPVLPTLASGSSPLGALAQTGTAAGSAVAAGIADRSFSALSAQINQVNAQLPGSAKILEVKTDTRSVIVPDLLIRQGNLALTRYRQSAARFYGEQMTAMFRPRMEWPAPPDIAEVQQRATADIDVLRGISLMEGGALMPFIAQPGLAKQVTDQLTHGHWSAVLDRLQTLGLIDAETAAAVRADTEAIGQIFDPAECVAAWRDAEQTIGAVVADYPQSTAALINLAVFLSESAEFDYVTSGTLDADRLRLARTYFSQARTLLVERGDPAARGELARCCLYAARRIPPDADLGSVPLAAMFAELQRASMSRKAQQTIQWDALRRGVALNYHEFVNERGVAEARDLFAAAGETVLANECGQLLLSQQEARISQDERVRQLESIWPVVGSWGYRGTSNQGSVGGVLVLNATGGFRWQADVEPTQFSAAQRAIVMGNYQVVGSMLQMQGGQWTIPPQLVPVGPAIQPIPYSTQLAVQSHTDEQLYLSRREDNFQAQYWRL
jgi:hypothetical protein